MSFRSAVWRGAPIAVLSMASIAVAAQTPEPHGASPEHIPWSLLAFAAVNFTIFVYVIIVRGLLPSLRRYAIERRDRVVREIEEATAARAEAEALRAEWQRRLDHLEGEIAEIRQAARDDAGRERDRILAAARETATAIERDARRAAASEIVRAQSTLRKEVARQAVSIAERLVRERLTDADQQRFVEEFLEQVSQ